ncbi:MAG: multiheme c-type cytochrome [Planctomycetota bacterium]|jgi:hypothetical protein
MQTTFHRRITAALGLLACAAGCRSDAPSQRRPLAIVVSGDTAGWIVPCGCASNQSGGLPRRGTFMEKLSRSTEVVLADVGGAPAAASPYDRVRFEAILSGEAAMGVAAHNVGGPEATLGPDYLRESAKRLNVPLVSANTRDADGRPIAEPLRIVEAAGRRVALVGVLSEKYATDGVSVAPPRDAVLDALDRASGRYDVVVVLAYLPEEELCDLAETLPEADVVVGGPTGQPVAPVSIGPTLLASATRQGKFLARLDAPVAGATGRWSGTIVELDERFDDNPRQLANLQAFYARLAERDFAPEQTPFAKPLAAARPGHRIAGSESCRECHAEDDALWESSGHAHAWESLREKGAHVDPECQRCHTTGYGLPGGFASVDRSAERVDVGCESCHGPSHGHALDPEVPTAHFAGAKDHCVGCHDRENSPHFELDAYWKKIHHGTPKHAAESTTTSGNRR